MAILTTGSFEGQVRAKLGVYDDELPDTELNIPAFKDLAEATVAKRVPKYAEIVDATDLLYLENATICYICYLVAPSMPRRLNTEVTTLDTKWKKAVVNWDDMAQKFMAEYESSIGSITTVDVTDDGLSETQIVNIITHTRDYI